jgi:hypothetical protein
VLGRGPRQNLFWSEPSLLPKSGITTTNALHPAQNLSNLKNASKSTKYITLAK